MPPAPKHPSVRQNRIKRPELGIVPVDGPELVIPKVPRGLLASTRERWRAYWASPVARAVDQNADLHRVERWIRTVDEYERCHAVFVKARLVKGSTGQPVLNPLGAYLSTLLSELSRAETDLGLTPLARLRLGVVYGQAQLTAAELNRALEEAEPREVEDWEREWSEA